MTGRSQAAFDFGGPGRVTRPVDPDALTTAEAREAASAGFEAGRTRQPETACPYPDKGAKNQALRRNWRAYWALGIRRPAASA